MLVKFGIRNVRRNSRRSAVAIATVAAGVFGLLFIQGFFSGLLKTHARNSIHSRHGHGQITTKGYWGQPFEKPMEHWIKDPSQIIGDLEKNPMVDQFFPRVQFFALLSNGMVNVAGRGQGIIGTKEAKFFDQLNFVEGGPIGETKDGIILGLGLARALNIKVGDPLTILGQTVDGTLNGVDATVTGIFHVGFKEADDMLFQIQLEQAKLLLASEAIETIVIGLKNEDDWPFFASQISAMEHGMEAMSVYVIDQVWAENGRLFLTALMNLFRLIYLGVILLAIYNSASNTVLERKREIGMLRANGETRASIVLLFVIEGAFIAFCGAVIGVVGVFMTELVIPQGIWMPPTPGTSRALAIKLSLDWDSSLIAWLLGFGTATVATWLSALQVLKIPVAKALRL